MDKSGLVSPMALVHGFARTLGLDGVRDLLKGREGVEPAEVAALDLDPSGRIAALFWEEVVPTAVAVAVAAKAAADVARAYAATGLTAPDVLARLVDSLGRLDRVDRVMAFCGRAVSRQREIFGIRSGEPLFVDESGLAVLATSGRRSAAAEAIAIQAAVNACRCAINAVSDATPRPVPYRVPWEALRRSRYLAYALIEMVVDPRPFDELGGLPVGPPQDVMVWATVVADAELLESVAVALAAHASGVTWFEDLFRAVESAAGGRGTEELSAGGIRCPDPSAGPPPRPGCGPWPD